MVCIEQEHRWRFRLKGQNLQSGGSMPQRCHNRFHIHQSDYLARAVFRLQSSLRTLTVSPLLQNAVFSSQASLVRHGA